METAVKNEPVIMRKEIDPMTSDPFEFLEASDLYPKWYWENREKTMQIAALGCQHSQNEMPTFSESSDIRYYGALHFSSPREPLWQPFPLKTFFVPKLEWNKCDNKISAFAHSNDEYSFTFSKSSRKGTSLSPYRRLDLPFYGMWQKNVLESLQLMEKKKLQKVVLARRSTLTFPAFLSPLQVLRKLNRVKGRGYLFFYQPNPHTAFLGASPESLFKREGARLYSEAIAGTRKRGKTQEEDETLKSELLRSFKEQKEFAFVEDFLLKTLSPHLDQMEFQERGTVLTTPFVQHLYSRLTGNLKKGGDDLLLSLLHPTPATLGTPKEEASQFLQQFEPFARGLYAAPIGWVSGSGAEFAVGIRSCLLEKNHAHLFAAAGILQGSNPENEWEELEEKIALFKEGVFGSAL